MAAFLSRTCHFRLNLRYAKSILPQVRVVVKQYKNAGLLARHCSAETGKEVVKEEPREDDGYREKFIPITRRSLIRHLLEKENFLNDEEKRRFEDFALALDSAIVNKYHGVLQELKTLFDPINPDKDTVQTRKWTPHERADNEFWLLQRLDDIMEKANFQSLPQSEVKKALESHNASEGVKISSLRRELRKKKGGVLPLDQSEHLLEQLIAVSVDMSKFDVLKFWALGKETPKMKTPWYQQLMWKTANPPTPVQYYKRLVVVMRLKKDQKLILKSFKEIPVGSLVTVLPNGNIEIRTFDKWVINAAVSVAALGIVAKIVMLLVHKPQEIAPAVTFIMALIGFAAWTSYNNKRTKYLSDVVNTLYFKNIANNRGLLALLVDRAEDESFKEALLVYSFLLANRPPSAQEVKSIEQQPSDLGGIRQIFLEENIQEWILETTGTKIEMDSSEAIKLLSNFGILSSDDDKLHVLPLAAAIRNLPQQPQSLVARAEESDISEGYDRDDFLESQEQFEKRESKTKASQWK